MAEAVTLVAAGALSLGGGDLQAWLPAYVVLAALAVAAGALLVRSVMEHGRTPSEIECSGIVMLARNRRGQLLGLSWQEVTTLIPARTRFPVLGRPLTDLSISVRFRRNEVLENLSQEAAHKLLEVYNRRARGLSPEEARKAADGWFDIRRY